jgi:hypothetical protein
MQKYGLSTAVLKSYLDDFHGITLTYYRREEADEGRIAVCTDCHGIHDIVSLSEQDPAVLKPILQQRCQRCHEGATGSFPDTWLSHYEPSWSRAPLVYLVNAVYQVLIPFMIVGLSLQILLHIWRYAVNR